MKNKIIHVLWRLFKPVRVEARIEELRKEVENYRAFIDLTFDGRVACGSLWDILIKERNLVIKKYELLSGRSWFVERTANEYIAQTTRI